MDYETPRIKTVAMDDVLSELGPARALLYPGGGGQKGGSGQGGGSGKDGGNTPSKS